MFGVLYLIICILVGREITERFLLRRVRETTGNRIWILLPMSFGSGILLLTWMTYILAYLNAVIGKARYPLFAANIIVIGAGLGFLFVIYTNKKKYGERIIPKDFVNEQVLFKKEVLCFVFLLIFSLFIMFWVFGVSGRNIYAGVTVFSDYAPHTSMIRSFSKGNNFPTQYPHFGGEDVKYHFMFQFLVGNLEYLGLRIDWAYNLPSILALIGFLMLLYKLSARIMGRFLTGLITVFIFFFRSGIAFFQYIWEHIQAGDLWRTLVENHNFIGYTPNENWGLWCFNVYLNQRHLAFGMLIVCMALWVFMDWLEAGEEHTEKGLRWFAKRIFSKEAWQSRDLAAAVLIGVLLGLSAFWNGATVIGGLLILAGFALFSDGKLDYAVMALITIILSEIQSKVFMTDSSLGLAFRWGFIAEDKSLLGVLWYMFRVSGIYYLGVIFLALFLKRMQRSVMFAFLLPVLFAFTISLTPDITVNHKYIMISYAFLAMFWAWGLLEIWRKRHGAQLVSVILAICLFATGVYDFVIIVRNNGEGHRIVIDMDDTTTEWLCENLSSEDLILTPEYSINAITMSGVMMYCGWPYYAWSAGYDTYRRADIAKQLYSSDDLNWIRRTVEEEGITYILYEDDMKIEEQECKEDHIKELYTLVHQSENGRIRVYETR